MKIIKWYLLLSATVFATILSGQRSLVFTEEGRLVAGMYNEIQLAECININDVTEVFFERIEHYLSPQLHRDTLHKEFIRNRSFVITPPLEARVGVIVLFQHVLDTTFFCQNH